MKGTNKDKSCWTHAVIKEPHKTYVFDAVDKAEGRKYYIEVLHNEIHIASTFQPTQLTEENIVNEHLNVSTQLKATSDNKTVP